ncbi:hypothetical protein L9F63_013850, partial [Diploptera punctata]
AAYSLPHAYFTKLLIDASTTKINEAALILNGPKVLMLFTFHETKRLINRISYRTKSVFHLCNATIFLYYF